MAKKPEIKYRKIKPPLQNISMEGVDERLFADLKQLRREIANIQRIAAMRVFSDDALRDMARRRPVTRDGLLLCVGVSEEKYELFGEDYREVIAEYCKRYRLASNIDPSDDSTKIVSSRREPRRKIIAENRLEAVYQLFDEGLELETVEQKAKLKSGGAVRFLLKYIELEGMQNPFPWVDIRTFEKILDVVIRSDADKIRQVYDYLDGEIEYDDIRISMACIKNRRL